MIQKKPRLSIIIVNYKSAGHLRKCLVSLEKKITLLPFEVIVVNNSDEDISFAGDLGNYSTRLYTINENVGFAKACNYGAQKAQAPFFAFINPDTELLSDNIKYILDTFQNRSNVGIIGAKLVSSDKRVQAWCAGKETDIWDIVRNNIGIVKSRRIWESKKIRNADWVSGAAFFISASAFEKLQGFCDEYFMYFEDQDMCRRARRLGYRVLYCPEVSFQHEGSVSFTKEKHKQKQYYYASQNIFFKRHYGKTQIFLLKFLRKIFTKHA
jgi:N-acetylglucosaminyl-diphospho-decaprenol L-rhamnosyltransferase